MCEFKHINVAMMKGGVNVVLMRKVIVVEGYLGSASLIVEVLRSEAEWSLVFPFSVDFQTRAAHG